MGRKILFATLTAGLLALGGGTAFAAVVDGMLGADNLAGGNAPGTLLGGARQELARRQGRRRPAPGRGG